MIKNNKGITLVELIVSIALISIVIMFLFRLLVDVRYNENNMDFNRKNQQTHPYQFKVRMHYQTPPFRENFSAQHAWSLLLQCV